MSDWPSWGGSWLGSWGASWGPLHEVDDYEWDTSQGVAGSYRPRNVDMRGYEERILRERRAYNLTRLRKEDQLVAEFIMALVQSELLDG